MHVLHRNSIIGKHSLLMPTTAINHISFLLQQWTMSSTTLTIFTSTCSRWWCLSKQEVFDVHQSTFYVTFISQVTVDALVKRVHFPVNAQKSNKWKKTIFPKRLHHWLWWKSTLTKKTDIGLFYFNTLNVQQRVRTQKSGLSEQAIDLWTWQVTESVCFVCSLFISAIEPQVTVYVPQNNNQPC
jgi:hypothetical protein